jgi:alpha-mannosidase
MLDVILVPPGETTQTFDLALGLDREYPVQTALGMVTPVPWVPVAKGPPHVGASGWLFHLDAPNLLLTSLRPAAGGTDAVTARLLDGGVQSGQAEWRCVRNPRRAVLQDARGANLRDADTQGDAALFEVSAGDLVQLRLEFG